MFHRGPPRFLLFLPLLCHLRKIYLSSASLISFEFSRALSPSRSRHSYAVALNVPSINNKSFNKIRWDTSDIVKLQRCGQICTNTLTQTLKWTKRIISIHTFHCLTFDQCCADDMWCNRLSLELNLKAQLNDLMICIVCTSAVRLNAHNDSNRVALAKIKFFIRLKILFVHYLESCLFPYNFRCKSNTHSRKSQHWTQKWSLHDACKLYPRVLMCIFINWIYFCNLQNASNSIKPINDSVMTQAFFQICPINHVACMDWIHGFYLKNRKQILYTSYCVRLV